MTRPARRSIAILVCGFASLGAVALAAIANDNREAWFGVEPRNAAHNFSFNLTFFLPVMLLGIVLACCALVLYIRNLHRLRSNGARAGALDWLAILPALPTLIVSALFIVFIVRLMSS